VPFSSDCAFQLRPPECRVGSSWADQELRLSLASRAFTYIIRTVHSLRASWEAGVVRLFTDWLPWFTDNESHHHPTSGSAWGVSPERLRVALRSLPEPPRCPPGLATPFKRRRIAPPSGFIARSSFVAPPCVPKFGPTAAQKQATPCLTHYGKRLATTTSADFTPIETNLTLRILWPPCGFRQNLNQTPIGQQTAA
jgi:hypothetical protein